MQTKQETSGEIQLRGGYVFGWMLDGKETELFGWITAKDGRQVPHTSGWYRTKDPKIAVVHALRAANLID